MKILRFSFGEFSLDASERQLRRGAEPLEVNGRYFDALLLLVREAGRLVSKDRFMEEVWRGVPVTDEALTQCIRTLRRALGDEAGRPRYIETVPKHGYRFIAPVEDAGSGLLAPPRRGYELLLLAVAGTGGGAVAGVLGGLVYGFAAAGQPGVGAASTVAVVVTVCAAVGALGAGGVAGGIAALGPGRPLRWSVAGGALGGLAVGALFRLVGLDAFALLLGRAPMGVAGPFEGVLLGAAVGLGMGLALGGTGSARRAAGMAAAICGSVGLVIPLLGGRLMAGSLQLLSDSFAGSRFRLDSVGRLFGEPGLGPVSQAVTSALEGALFGGCITAAMLIAARRSLPRAG